MAITKEKKEQSITTLRDIVQEARTVVFANFRGLTVAEQNEMRKGLRGSQVGYAVVKKTLLRRVLSERQYAGTTPALEGEIALAYAGDALAPARELAIFIRKFPEHIGFAGGIFDGSYVDAAKIKSIAAIPPLEVVRAQFLFMILSPIQQLAVVLDQVAVKRGE